MSWPYIDPILCARIRPFGEFKAGISTGSGTEEIVFTYQIGKRLKGLIFSVYGRPYQAFIWRIKVNDEIWPERGQISFDPSTGLDATIDPWLCHWTDRMILLKDGDRFQFILISNEAVGYAYHVAGYEYELK